MITQQEKKDQLLKLYTELNNINETIILMLGMPYNDIYKKEFERLGSGARKQEVLKQIRELREDLQK